MDGRSSRAIAPDGGGIHIVDHGPVDAEPLLLIAGMNQDHTAWEPQVAGLADAYRVITFDNRGTGESDDLETGDNTYDEPVTTGTLAEHAVAVLKHLGIARAHVLGHSMGGRIAQWMAVSHAKHVGALILSATSPGETRGVARSADVDRRLLSGNPAELGLLNYSSAWMQANLALVRRIDASITQRSRQRAIHYHASHSHDCWRSLSRITAPTLVIHGQADEINSWENGRLLAEHIPGAQMRVIEKGRHGFAAEFAERYNCAVAEFLAAHPLASA